MALTITPEITGQTVTEARTYKYIFEPLRVLISDPITVGVNITVKIRSYIDGSILSTNTDYVQAVFDSNSEVTLDLMQIGRDFLSENLYKINQSTDITPDTIVPGFYFDFEIFNVSEIKNVNIVPILGGRSFNQFSTGLDYTTPLTEWAINGLSQPNFKDFPVFSSSLVELIEGTAATTEHPRWDDSGDVNIYGRDTFNFAALPGGNREPNGSFINIGSFGYWWSATETNTSIALLRDMRYFDSSVSRSGSVKETGYSIRLVRPYETADGDKVDGRILTDAVTDFDGNIYDGVIIGNQVWTTENLKTTSYADGTAIPTNYNDTDWSNLTTGAYTQYPPSIVSGIDSSAEMIEFYGLLYNWYAVDDAKGLVSGTFHVPTDAEFTQLTDYIIANYPDIDSTNVGDHLKSTRQVNSPLTFDDIRPSINITTDSDGRDVCGAYVIWKSRFGGWMSYGFDIYSEDGNLSYEQDIQQGLFEANDNGNPYVPTDYTRISESYTVNLRAIAVPKDEAKALKSLTSASVCYLMREPDSKMELMRISSFSAPVTNLTDGVDVSLSLSSISESSQNIR